MGKRLMGKEEGKMEEEYEEEEADEGRRWSSG